MNRSRLRCFAASALAYAGFCLSFFLAYRVWRGAEALCLPGSGCSSVTIGPHSTFLGLPWAVWGLMHYGAVYLVVTAFLDTSRRALLGLARILAVLGLVVSVYLVFVQATHVGAFCSLCSLSAVISSAVFAAIGMPNRSPVLAGGLALPLFALALLLRPTWLRAEPGARSEPPQVGYELRPGGSQGVLYTFPTDGDAISVGRSGELTLGLAIPSYPGYMAPILNAVYNSRGGDGPLGVGWDIPIPSVALDFSEGAQPLELDPEDQIVSVDGRELLRKRWVARPGGELVCEAPEDGGTWHTFACFGNPRGAIRYSPVGQTFVERWTAVDPLDGVTQEFGTGYASQIRNSERPVAWLLSSERNREGKEVRYLWEERKGSDQRLLAGVHYAGDKTIRFRYEQRSTRTGPSYDLSVRRSVDYLLAEIQLLDPCTPNQIEKDVDDVYVDWSGCNTKSPREKIVLSYGRPEDRFTGRYVLRSWQHMSGDGSVRYAPVQFEYNGDGVALLGDGTKTDNHVREVPTEFEVPDGFTQASSVGHAPFQSYADFDRDGLPDWIYTKNSNSRYWPDWRETEHKIFVRTRAADGDFNPRREYQEPLARYSAWLYQGAGKDDLFGYTEPLDELGFASRSIEPREIDDLVAEYWPEATIGINTRSWIYDSADEEDVPIFGSLTMSVNCKDLGMEAICSDLKDTWKDVWNRSWDNEWDRLSIQLTDLRDFNGDGYLDRAVSGLIVVWDPNAPDADVNGLRRPTEGDPCIYVSLFDPEADDFQPFQRYAIHMPGGGMSHLSTAFVSALGITFLNNQNPSPSDMSSHATVATALHAGGIANDFLSLWDYFLPQNAATEKAGPGVAQLAMVSANAAVQLADLPPEVGQAMAYYGTANQLRSGMQGIAQSTAVLQEAGGKSLAGWGSLAGSLASVAAVATNFTWRERSEALIETPGYNPGVIAVNTKVGTTAVTFGASLIGVGAAIATWSSPTIAGAVIGAVIALTGFVWSATSAEGGVDWKEGEVRYDIYGKRGIKWKKFVPSDDALTDEPMMKSTTDQVLAWMDITGDGRLDLVVSRYSPLEAGFAVCPAASVEDVYDLDLDAWRTWGFEAGDGPEAMTSMRGTTYYMLGDVHRADQIDVVRSFADMNGDGLVDLIETEDVSGYGIGVYLNTRTGFAGRQLFSADAATAPGSCSNSLKIARSRSLSWIEYDGKKEGYAVALQNGIQQLGLDVNSDGLPDLVIKDETSYPAIEAGGDCVLHRGDGMCDATMPTDPEPAKGDDCQDAANVWFACFDGYGTTDGTNEGDSHLSRAAYQVHSPMTKGHQYVAFNTGSGFTPFVRITPGLPSFSGGLSVVRVTNTDTATPTWATSGTSSFVTDTDGEGRLELIALDISDSAIMHLSGVHPVAAQYEIGLKNPDALTRIAYPEGGQVMFTYSRKRDVGGLQGPPLWVLSQAVFDDKVRTDFNAAESWSGTNPFVNYAYDGAKLVEREFLGFEVIGETRFDGEKVAQVLELYEQNGAARGSVLCRELRGTGLEDGDAVTRIEEHPTCELERGPAVELGPPPQEGILGLDLPAQTTRLAARTVPISRQRTSSQGQSDCDEDDGREPDAEKDRPVQDGWTDDTGKIGSCYANAATLGLGALYPLQKRTSLGYDTSATIRDSENGVTYEVLRDVFLRTMTVNTYNGSGRSAWTRTRYDYDPSPFKTPTRAEISTSEGLSRTQATRWLHYENEWVFLKDREVKADADGNARLTTNYSYEGSAPFHLLEYRESWNGQQRTRTYEAYDDGGLPTSITEAGVNTIYTYWPDSQPGTSKLKTSTRSSDAYQPTVGTEEYAYDAMGRTRMYRDARGYVSRHTYDALGLPESDLRAGLAPMHYDYRNIGSTGFDRSYAGLSTAQRTITTQELDGATIANMTWWDGFYRPFRKGTAVDGTRGVSMDLDGDGEIDLQRTVNDGDWFSQNQARILLRDYRLTGGGEIQCTSLPFFDEDDPNGYETTLRDPQGRFLHQIDFEGAETRTKYAVDLDERKTSLTVDPVGGFTFRVFDGLGRTILENRSGLERTKATYDVWDSLVRVTDKRGFARILEVNGWGDPLKVCQQIAGVAPDGNICPDDWPTIRYTYDDFGQVRRIRDPNGNVISIENSGCRQPGEIIYPSSSTGDAARTSTRRFTYDENCNPTEIVERNGQSTITRYDAANRLVAVVRAEGSLEASTTRYGYDALGRSLYQEDPLGRRSYSLRDFRGLTVQAVRPDGGTVQSSFGVHGHLESRTDPGGSTTSLTNDLMGRMTVRQRSDAVCDEAAISASTLGWSTADLRETFRYDALGRLTDRYDASGNRSAWEYDDLGRVVREYGPDLTTPGALDTSVYEEFSYDPAGNLVAVKDRGGHVVRMKRDGAGRLVERIAGRGPSSAVWSYEYDASGNVISKRSPNSSADSCTRTPSTADEFSTDYTYNSWNQVESVTLPAAADGTRATTRTSYYSYGVPETYEDERGFSTTFVYNHHGKVKRVMWPDGTSVVRKYDRAGNEIEIENEIGLKTTLEYDPLNRLVEINRPGGRKGVLEYDPVGRVVMKAARVDMATDTWQGLLLEYSIGGRAIATSRAHGTGLPAPSASDLTVATSEHQCHDPVGHVVARQDAMGNVSRSGYDARGRRIAEFMTPVAGSGWDEVRYEYNVEDQLVRVDAPMGGATGPATVVSRYAYDELHRPVLEAFTQARAVLRRTFDPGGNLCRTERAVSGSVVSQVDHLYDPRGLLLERRPSVGPVERFAYDASGNLIRAEDGSGSWEQDYDERGRVIRISQTIDDLALSFETRFDLDGRGVLELMTLPTAPGFPAAPKQVEVVCDPTSGLPQVVRTDLHDVAAAIEYDGLDRILGWTLGNGATWRDELDELGRLRERRVQRGSESALSTALVYDDNDQPILVDDQDEDRRDLRFTYDVRNRLASAGSPILRGNWNYTFNSSDLLEEVVGPLPAASRRMHYDARGNLDKVEQATGAVVDFESDVRGNRVLGGPAGNQYDYDAYDRLIAVKDAGGTPHSRLEYAFDGRLVSSNDRFFVYGAGRLPLLELRVAPDGTIAQVKSSVHFGGMLAQTVDARSGLAHFYAWDHVGSPVASMTSVGPILRRGFDPFGKELPATPPPASGARFPTDIGFQHNPHGPGPDLVRMGARYYDTFSGAFLTADPLGAQSGSRYAFARGNPITLSDPLGLSPQETSSQAVIETYDPVTNTTTMDWTEALPISGAGPSLDMGAQLEILLAEEQESVVVEAHVQEIEPVVPGAGFEKWNPENNELGANWVTRNALDSSVGVSFLFAQGFSYVASPEGPQRAADLRQRYDEIVDEALPYPDLYDGVFNGAEREESGVDYLVLDATSLLAGGFISTLFAEVRVATSLNVTDGSELLGLIDDFVDLTGHRRAHILNRHRAGAGKAGKTEFPESWSDDRIIHHVSDIATDPNAVTGTGKWNSPYAIGTRDGVQVRVDFYPPNHPSYAGQISTAYPIQ